MYSCIYLYMAIRTYIYADCLADLIMVHPFSVPYHGTACSLLRSLPLGLPLFPMTAEPSGETVSYILLLSIGLSSDGLPLYRNLLALLRQRQLCWHNFIHPGFRAWQRYCHFLSRAVKCVYRYRQRRQLLGLGFILSVTLHFKSFMAFFSFFR